MLNSTQPFNVVVTNVPGPPMPLYLMDARMDTIYPHLPLFEGQGLGIALLSYAGKLTWGLTGDWDLIPTLDSCVTRSASRWPSSAALARAIEAGARREIPTIPRARRSDGAEKTATDVDVRPR